MKLNFSEKEVRTTLLAAFVGTLVALILSPISQTISFSLNEYLSRPLLSIEYIELIPKEQPIDIPSVKLSELVQANGYRLLLETNSGGASELTTYLNRESLSSSEELKSFIESVRRFIVSAERRKNIIDSLNSRSSSNLTEMQTRTILSTYFGTAAQYYAMNATGESLRSMLLLHIQREKESLESALQMASEIQNTLEQIRPSLGGTLKLKLNILNRGRTDGLIRNIGEFRFENGASSIPIKRTQPDESFSQSMLESIPVTVTNPTEGSFRSASVGKIESSSMAEMWYEIDKSTLSPENVNKLWAILADSVDHHYSIILFDHTNNEVKHSFSWDATINKTQ